MSEIIHFTRIGRMPTTVIEVVYSPDEGGYYLSNTDFQNNKHRASVKVYPTDAAAKADWNADTVAWDAGAATALALAGRREVPEVLAGRRN